MTGSGRCSPPCPSSLISLGFNNLKAWGMLLASPDAPVSVLGMSPSPIMIVVGVVLGQGFFAWSHRRQAQGKTPLLALEVLDSPQERAATYCLFIIAAIGPAVNFLIPLYIQIVQGAHQPADSRWRLFPTRWPFLPLRHWSCACLTA